MSAWSITGGCGRGAKLVVSRLGRVDFRGWRVRYSPQTADDASRPIPWVHEYEVPSPGGSVFPNGDRALGSPVHRLRTAVSEWFVPGRRGECVVMSGAARGPGEPPIQGRRRFRAAAQASVAPSAWDARLRAAGFSACAGLLSISGCLDDGLVGSAWFGRERRHDHGYVAPPADRQRLPLDTRPEPLSPTRCGGTCGFATIA